jgi:hypothetical protein
MVLGISSGKEVILVLLDEDLKVTVLNLLMPAKGGLHLVEGAEWYRELGCRLRRWYR